MLGRYTDFAQINSFWNGHFLLDVYIHQRRKLYYTTAGVPVCLSVNSIMENG